MLISNWLFHFVKDIDIDATKAANDQFNLLFSSSISEKAVASDLDHATHAGFHGDEYWPSDDELSDNDDSVVAVEDENSDEDSALEDADVAMYQPCQPCVADCVSVAGSTSSAGSGTNRHGRPKDEQIKSFAKDTMSIGVGNFHCNPSTCCNHGGCVGNTTIAETMALRKSFWQGDETEAPSTNTRSILILKILGQAWNHHSQAFIFYSTNTPGANRVVCEAGYLILLGLSKYQNACDAPGQWLRTKKKIISRMNDMPEELPKGMVTSKFKSDDCRSYIQYIADIFVCDKTATAGAIFFIYLFHLFNFIIMLHRNGRRIHFAV